MQEKDSCGAFSSLHQQVQPSLPEITSIYDLTAKANRFCKKCNCDWIRISLDVMRIFCNFEYLASHKYIISERTSKMFIDIKKDYLMN